MKKQALLMPLLIVLLLSFSFPARSAEPAPQKTRVAILPFELNAPSELSYLKAGVEAMLASRLSARGGVTVVDQHSVRQALEETGSAVPAVVGPRLEADLVLSGSITALGQAISIDVRGVRLKGEQGEERFYATANNPGEVIGAVDQLVDDIGGHMFKGGVKSAATKAHAGPLGSAGGAPEKSAAGQENQPEQTLHPDRLFREKETKTARTGVAPPSVPPLPAPVATATPVGQPVGVAAGGSEALRMINRSQSLDMEIQSLDVGDIFGDGSPVLAIAEEHHVHVYRQNGGGLVPAGDLPDPPGYVRVVEVNLADLNGNGRAEIYVSTISGFQPLSYAYEWDGKTFAPLFEKQPWHLRPVNMPGRGMVLAGQQGSASTPLVEGIYIMTLKDGQLQSGEKLPLPPQVNLFEFVLADFNGDGKAELAAVDKDDDLELYGADGEVLWRGSEKYAYTVRYIGAAGGTAEARKLNRNVPGRLIAADVNGDGRPDLVVMQNPSSLSALLKTIGSFVGGEVQFLAWNGISFVEVWSSGPIGSYLASYQLGLAPSGQGEALYLGLITKKSGLTLFGYRSLVATYPLGKMGQKQP